MHPYPAENLKGEQGFALILVLVMLGILSLLGILALNTSHSELTITSNFKTSQRAFSAAERAVEYALANPAIVGATASATNLNPYAASITIDNSGLDTSATNVLRNLGVGELPDFLAQSYSQEKFGGNFYNISVQTRGPGGRSKARVETQQIRIFQKDDEGQLITTSGG
ncbi:hypothetical protein JCM30471_18960 [Desulfuromonas carbonis]|uniref:pilus assembly PilX family protein n=1 Tax=Desulfuromonas sp. DDH964 TaxID=1823759 RepID=UPI00078D6EA6|nr:PilX N-terminal domain-containing pilus assembly protein [Desulfuromonas sp. DDH964]AMV73481.1 hypothetical protein DBW_3174 [Desulfuromonas sp. DDH964]